VILALLIHWWKDMQSGHTKNPAVWLTARTWHDTEEKMLWQNVSAWVGVCQLLEIGIHQIDIYHY